MSNPCPESPYCVKQVEIHDIRTPSEAVEPGHRVRFEVVMVNHAWSILFDPDGCQISDVFKNGGYKTTVTLSIPALGWEQSETKCVTVGDVSPPGVTIFEFQLDEAPANDTSEADSYTVEATATMPASGKSTDGPYTATFTVAPQGTGSIDPNPGDGSNGGGGGGGSWFDKIIGTNSQLGDVQRILILVILIWLLFKFT